jgi:chaperonin GroES
MKLKPLQDNLLVEIEPKTDKSSGGLYMPDSAEKPRMIGTVLAVGPDIKNIKAGDKVYVTYRDAFATTVVDTWIFPEKNILAIVE